MLFRSAILLFLIACQWVESRDLWRSLNTWITQANQQYNHTDKPNCSEFSDDYEVLMNFPFPILINPMSWPYPMPTYALMDDNGTYVQTIRLSKEIHLPPTVFCLRRLESLTVFRTPFLNDVVPHSLSQLTKLTTLDIRDVPINEMTERLGMLSSLHSLHLTNCSLSHFPNLENIPDLYNVDFSDNPLSQINGFNNVFYLLLDNCRFTELPTLTNPSRLGKLSMNNNPLKHVSKIASLINLRSLDLNNSTLSSIPPTIDRLQKLARLSLGHNKISSLPTNILKVSSLIYVDLSNNSFTTMELDSIRKQFLTRLPNTTLVT